MTDAADRFTDAILQSWDHQGCWTDTAREGLSEVDVEALTALCVETGDDYLTAEAEVLAFVSEKASSARE